MDHEAKKRRRENMGFEKAHPDADTWNKGWMGHWFCPVGGRINCNFSYMYVFKKKVKKNNRTPNKNFCATNRKIVLFL